LCASNLLSERQTSDTHSIMKSDRANAATHEPPQQIDSQAITAEREAQFAALVNASSDVLFRMNADWSEMRQLNSTGFLAPIAEPHTTWFEQYIPADAQPAVRAAIDDAVRTKSVFQIEHAVRRADGTVGRILSRAIPLFDADGNTTEWFGAASDVTARRRAEGGLRSALAEKETLLKEVHHRVKNNLQMIDSLLRLQADAFPDPRLREVVRDTANRVQVIAEIHQLLYNSADLAKVDMATFLERLCASLSAMLAGSSQPVRLLVNVEPLQIDLQRAVPLGLIFNELISNALKHAFGRGTGNVQVGLHREADEIVASVTDDGIGFPDPVPSDSLGLQLVRVLAGQMQGEVQFESSPSSSTDSSSAKSSNTSSTESLAGSATGARVSVRFPATDRAK
jgi:two-component sensor histidine kinase